MKRIINGWSDIIWVFWVRRKQITFWLIGSFQLKKCQNLLLSSITGLFFNRVSNSWIHVQNKLFFLVIQKNIKVIKISYKEKKLSENERIWIVDILLMKTGKWIWNNSWDVIWDSSTLDVYVHLTETACFQKQRYF